MRSDPEPTMGGPDPLAECPQGLDVPDFAADRPLKEAALDAGENLEHKRSCSASQEATDPPAPSAGTEAQDPASSGEAGDPEPQSLSSSESGGRTLASFPRPHDFQRPRLLSQVEVHALDTVHRKFAQAASAALSVLVRSRIHVELQSVDQRPYCEFTRALPNPTALSLVYCLPQRSPLVFEMSPGVVFPMIERLLGGRGNDVRQPARTLTRVEQRLAATVAEKVLAVLAETWSLDAEIRFDIVETEHNPLLMQIVGPAEPTLVLTFALSLGIKTGAMHLALPSKPFEAIIARIVRSSMPGLQTEPNTDREREAILRRMSGTELTLSAELESIPVELKDLLGLEPGDTIDTQLSRGSEVSVLVEGKRVFRGLAALRDGRRAVKITRVEAEEP